MPDERSDSELVDAANAGDSEALGLLYLRYRDWAVRLAYRFTGDADVALDVMQASFTYFFGKFPGFRLRARITTFLYPVIKNTALAAKRKLRPDSGIDDVHGAPSSSSASLEREALAAAVARLPGVQREVLLMRTVDGMSPTEISLALGIPEGTVKSRFHHALESLRADERLRTSLDV